MTMRPSGGCPRPPRVAARRTAAFDAVPLVAGRVIGFGPHVDAELLAAAEAAGRDEVLPRSVFFRRVADLAAGAG